MIGSSPDGPIPPDKGSYIIILRLMTDRTIRIGRLGEFSFQQGYFAYVGSAHGPGGLASRIRHHLTGSARPHWHVDYLGELAIPEEVWISKQKDRREHIWASILSRWDETRIPVPGFGCSDCKCRTHLFSFEQRPSFSDFSRMARQALPKDRAIICITLSERLTVTPDQ